MVARTRVAIAAIVAMSIFASASVALAHNARLAPRTSGVGSPGVPTWSLVRGAVGPVSAYVPVRVSWAASGTAGACYDLTDMQGGSVTAGGSSLFGTSQFVQVQGTSAVIYSDSNDSSHTYAVQATDCGSKSSAWISGVPNSVDFFFGQSYAKRWITISGANQTIGGRFSTARGASVTMSGRARSIDLISNLGPQHGAAAIYVNGKRLAVIHTYSKIRRLDRIVWTANFLLNKPRTLRIVNLGTKGHPRVDFVAASAWVNVRP